MNIYINNYCNQACPYCFAKDYMHASGREEMSFDDFKRVIRFLEKSDFPRLRLEGGEATLHPYFTRFAEYALHRGFQISLFTNGLFPAEIQKFIRKRAASFQLCWNVNEPGFYREENWGRLLANIRALRSLRACALGVNIYRHDQDLGYMYDLCKKYPPRYLRVVFAHHVGGDARQKVIAHSDLSRKTREVTELVRRVAVDLSIPTVFDCGFIPCMWSDEQLGVLMKCAVRIGSCSLCPGIDYRLRVMHCFHTDSGRPLPRFSSLREVHDYLDRYKKRYDGLYLDEKCERCVQRRIGVCDTGCLGDRKFANMQKVI
jgi:MoaA/NifB/PqqE/SkfB family radical SAM enzyme